MERAELQSFLVSRFSSWQPAAAGVVARRAGDITLDWRQRAFAFLAPHLLYRLEKNNNLPKWIVVYSGGKTQKRIDNLAPRHPHRFRVKVILKTEAVPRLAELALQHYGDVDTVYEQMEQLNEEFDDDENESFNSGNDNKNGEDSKDCGDVKQETDNESSDKKKEKVTKMDMNKVVEAVRLVNEMKKRVDGDGDCIRSCEKPRWLESQWSSETWTNTDSSGTSPVCFSMAVKCGYLKQVQVMVEERPELLEIVNSNTGHTPLATAVKKGDINMVRLLLALGADVNQPSLAEQTPLQLAVLAADMPLTELLLEKGADPTARDCNGLRAEHYAVDCCELGMLRYILDRGDVAARDYTGWTPLFRAICQGARTSVVEELVQRGSDVDIVDSAGLPLMSAAKLLKNRHGKSRDSVMRLVDPQYPREKALANFTRISKKIGHVHALLRTN